MTRYALTDWTVWNGWRDLSQGNTGDKGNEVSSGNRAEWSPMNMIADPIGRLEVLLSIIHKN